MRSSKADTAKYMRNYYARNRESILKKNKEWRERNKERHLARAREYHQKNRERLLARKRQLRKERPEYYSDQLRLKKFGISKHQYQSMLEMQHGRCAICKVQTKLVVDHNHQNGVVRSLLCSPCNTALGLLKEDESLFFAAVEYLTFHKIKKSEAA